MHKSLGWRGENNGTRVGPYLRGWLAVLLVHVELDTEVTTVGELEVRSTLGMPTLYVMLPEGEIQSYGCGTKRK